MNFSISRKVRFSEVDPAGIVFYPRYFEMLNAAVEDWFETYIGASFASLHLDQLIGVPTVKIECEFFAPCYLGELVEISLSPTHVGESSCHISYSITGDKVLRIRGKAVLVCMNLRKKKSMHWPTKIKEKLLKGTVI